jgi:hypothetical protein
MMDKLKAVYEVPAAIATGAAAPFLGVGAGIIQNIQQGTNKRVDSPEFAQQFQFQPTSPVSQDILQGMGSALEASKLPPVMPGVGMLPSYARAAGGAPTQVRQAAQTVQETVPSMAQALRRQPQPTMAGVGAAEVPEAVNRVQMAQQLRVPVDLSKGQAMRDLGQQKFEIETPKQFPELGKPLIEAQAKRNDAILQNFDAFVDATGKETYGLRETGRIVDKALVNAANKAKTQISQAYDLARKNGEMEAPVSYAPIQQYIDSFAQRPTLKDDLAKIIKITEDELKINDPKKTGQINLNQLEDVYQLINKSYEPGTPSANYAIKLKELINQSMEGQGGKLFQEARALRTKYGREFENVGYVDKLLRTKPGTSDRSVAFEDVFDHAVLNGSLDDVSSIGRTLKKAGPEGQQAWKELQGQTIQYMKDQVSKSVDVDSFGNPVVSPAKFKAVVTQLDQDGKLDYLFGRKGAQEIRDLLETTINVNAPLKGAANYSNTASALITALDKVNQTPLGRIPGIGTISKFMVEKGKESALKKQIEESINYKPGSMANELRKGK